jgi:hypothetical protein
MKPKILVYSAKEDTGIAEAVQDNLQDCADVIVWNQDAFPLSEPTTVEGLTKHARTSDFGIFVLTPHDLVKIRGEEFAAPRDNLLFELGVFVGRLEKVRNILVLPHRQKHDPIPRIPTDLEGWMLCKYDPNQSNLKAALAPPCRKIRAHIESLGRRSSEVRIINKKSGKCLDVSGGGKEDRTPIIQYDYHGRGHQRWNLRRIDEKDIEIIARHSDKCLEVRDGNPEVGAVVQQRRRTDEQNQRWKLEIQDDGSYLIMARHSEKYLTVKAGSNENGAAVVQDHGQDDDSFKWWISSPFDTRDL